MPNALLSSSISASRSLFPGNVTAASKARVSSAVLKSKLLTKFENGTTVTMRVSQARISVRGEPSRVTRELGTFGEMDVLGESELSAVLGRIHAN